MRPPALTAALSRLRDHWRSQGHELDESRLAPRFEAHFTGCRAGPRIEVRTTYDDGTVWIRRGSVSISQGWQPVFLLMSQANSHGSSDVLKETDEITAVLSAPLQSSNFV